MAERSFDLKTIEPHGLYRSADEGHVYKWGNATITVKLSPEDTDFVNFACWKVTLPARKSVDFMALSATDRAYYCIAGSGEVVLNGDVKEVATGDVIFCGRGNNLEYQNTGEDELELMGFSIPAVPEVRIDILKEGYELKLEDCAVDLRRALGLMTTEEANCLDQGRRGDVFIMGPDDGDTYWQPKPSLGYVTVKTKPEYARKNNFGVALQKLEPGAHVVPHAHSRTAELLVCVKGKGKVYLEGAGEKEFRPGAIAMIGTRTFHNFHNTGSQEDGELIVAGLASPTEISEALSEIGIPRIVGEPTPDHIERDASRYQILKEKYGFIFK